MESSFFPNEHEHLPNIELITVSHSENRENISEYVCI